MPFALKDHDFAGELDSVNSAIVVPCRFCPAANLAMREDSPYIDLFRHFLRTPAYESYIRMLRLPGTLSLGLTGVSRLGRLDAKDVPFAGETV